MDIVDRDFETVSDELRRDYKIRKQSLWESETCADAELFVKEVEIIRDDQPNEPVIGYHRWPKFIPQD